jgi:hypothetical protein
MNQTRVFTQFMQHPLFEPHLSRMITNMGVDTYEKEMDRYLVVIDYVISQINQERQGKPKRILYQLTPDQDVYRIGHYQVMVFYLTFDIEGYNVSYPFPRRLHYPDGENDGGGENDAVFYKMKLDDIDMGEMMAERIYALQETGEFTRFHRALRNRENFALDRFFDVGLYNGRIPIVFPIHNTYIRRDHNLPTMIYYGNVDGYTYNLTDTSQYNTDLSNLGAWQPRTMELATFSYMVQQSFDDVIASFRIAVDSAIRQHNATRMTTDPQMEIQCLPEYDVGPIGGSDVKYIALHIRFVNVRGGRLPRLPVRDVLLKDPKGGDPNEIEVDKHFYQVSYEHTMKMIELLTEHIQRMCEQGDFKMYTGEVKPHEMLQLNGMSDFTARQANYIPLLFPYQGPYLDRLNDDFRPLRYVHPVNGKIYYYNYNRTQKRVAFASIRPIDLISM